MPSCVVFGCKTGYNSNKGKVDSYQFFRFPTAPKWNEKWCDQINRTNFQPSFQSRVCSKHFTPNSFLKDHENKDGNGKVRKKRRLYSTAVPTLFMNATRTHEVQHETLKLNLTDHSYVQSDSENKPKESGHNKCAFFSSVDFCDHDEVHDDTDIQNNVVVESDFEELCNETIVKLRQEVLDLSQKIKKLTAENTSLTSTAKSVERIFNDDQMERLKCPGSRKPFLNKTLQESIHLYYRIGTSSYEFLREKGFPLPSVRTLQNHLVALECEPGIQWDFINIMKYKVEKMTNGQKFCGLVMDEMSITPKIQFDQAIQAYVGHPTLPVSEKLRKKREAEIEKKKILGLDYDENKDELAYHALNVLLCGQTVRYKQLVGYHFTDRSFCAKAAAKWIMDLMKAIHEILGLTICSFTMDMSPLNQAL